jgi:hypothetical protein
MDSVTESTANVITGTYGNVQFGSLWLSNTTVSGSQTSGALVVKGGIGAGALSYLNSLTVDNNLTASGSGALITFSPTGGGYVTINPATAGSMDNMAIGGSTPKAGSFTTLTATQNNFNVTLSPTGSGTVAISPAGALTINPATTSNMDNVFIGNSTPRQASFTAATVGQDLKMSAFTANSALFISPASGNLSVDQSNENFNFQRATGNTFSGVSFSVGTGGDTQTGTDTLNIRYQGDSYTPQSVIAANTVGQIAGWTVSTSRGTGTAPVINQDGDVIGLHGAFNYSGSTPAYQEASAWRYVTQGTTGATSGIGGQAQLWTKRDNGASTLAMRVDANQITTFYGQVAIANTTTTTNSTTGALYVAGGVSAGGNIVLAQGARFNDSQTSNRDFYVRGQNDATLIWGYTGAYNSVVIGNSATTGDLVTGAKLQINSTDSILLPRGTDTNRPGAGGTAGGYGSAVAGMIRFNSGRNDIEYYTGSVWYSPQTSQLTIVEDQQFNGDGTTVDFTTSREVLASAALVTINGVVQTPSVSYTMSYYPTTLVANVVSFSEAPAVGDAIDIRSFTTTSTISRLASSNGFMTFEPRDTGIVISTGETQANISIVIQTDGAIAYTPGGVTIGTSPLVIDSFVKTTYRQAKYQIVVANSGNTEFETSEVMVIHNGTTAYRTQYNRIYTGAAALGTVTTSVVGANVYVYYTGVSSANNVKTVASYIG